MDLESHEAVQTKARNAAGTAPSSWSFFNGAISSRIKQMMQRKKGDATTTQEPPQPSQPPLPKPNHSVSITTAEPPQPNTEIVEERGESPASTSSSTSASTSASTSGSESSPLSKPGSSRRGTSLLERLTPSLKRKVNKRPKEESGAGMYILFDNDGNPKRNPRSKDRFMGGIIDSDTEET